MSSCFKVNMQENETGTLKKDGFGSLNQRDHARVFLSEVKTNYQNGGRLLLSMCVLLFSSPVYVSIKIL